MRFAVVLIFNLSLILIGLPLEVTYRQRIHTPPHHPILSKRVAPHLEFESLFEEELSDELSIFGLGRELLLFAKQLIDMIDCV